MRQRRIACITAVIAAVTTLSGCAWVRQADVPLAGTTPNQLSLNFWLSAGGRYVVFSSNATNLVPETADLDPHGGFLGLFRRDNLSGRTTLLQRGVGIPPDPGVSRNMRRILIADAGLHKLWDRDTGTVEHVAVDSSEVPLPGATVSATLSADGRFVALRRYVGQSGITTYLRDVDNDTTKLVNTIPEGTDNVWMGQLVDRLSISRDGSFLAQSTCTRSSFDGRLPFCQQWSMQLIEVASGNIRSPAPDQTSQFAPRLSADSRILVYQQAGRIQAYNRNTGTTTDVTVGWDGQPAGGTSPSISASGRYVAFESSAGNLVEGFNPLGQLHVFVRDRVLGVTTHLSAREDGSPMSGFTGWPEISADGRYVAFRNFGRGLVPSEGSDTFRVFTKSALIPRIDDVSPDSGARGSTVHVTISGFGFRQNSVVIVGQNGHTLGQANRVITETTIDVDVILPPDTPAAAYHVSVWTPGTGAGPEAGAAADCAGCFVVT
jgi:hypothetical protein